MSLVGKNESGKTTLLQALEHLNSVEPSRKRYNNSMHPFGYRFAKIASAMLRAVLALMVAGSVPALADGHCPAKPLPAPSGKYAIGSVVLPVQKLNGTGTSRQAQLWYRCNLVRRATELTTSRTLRSFESYTL